MTLFTEGRLQAYERMMRDNGNYHRGRSDGKPSRTGNGKTGANSFRKDFGKAGRKHSRRYIEICKYVRKDYERL